MSKILLVVDMQAGFTKNQEIYPLNNKILQHIEESNYEKVIATQFINERFSIYDKILNWQGMENIQDQELSINYNFDYVHKKYTYDTVDKQFLNKLTVLNKGTLPKEIYIVGVDTDACILTIATSLFENNIRPIVIEDLCMSNGGYESHLAGIKCLERLIGKSNICLEKEIKQKI